MLFGLGTEYAERTVTHELVSARFNSLHPDCHCCIRRFYYNALERTVTHDNQISNMDRNNHSALSYLDGMEHPYGKTCSIRYGVSVGKTETHRGGR